MASPKALVWIFLGCLGCFLPLEVKCRDIFTAYSHMAKLASIELELHKALNDYIKSEEDKLKELREFERRVASERKLENSAEGIKDYAANPIRAYLMLKRFVKQWKLLKLKMPGRQGIVFLKRLVCKNTRAFSLCTYSPQAVVYLFILINN